MKVQLKKDVSKNSFVVYPNHTVNEPNSLIFILNTYGYEELGKNYYLKRSGFHGNMLTYISKGSGFFSYNGKEYALEENDLIFINCIGEHIMYPNKKGMTIYFLHIDNLFLSDFCKVQEEEFGCVTNFKENNRIAELFYDLVFKYKDFDLYAKSLKIYEIISEIKRKSSSQEDNLKNILKNSPPVVFETSAYIKQNFTKINLTLNEIADAVGFNKYYLEKCFKKHTNYTVHSYLNYIRTINARLKLLESNDPIEKVATASGFYDAQVLIRYFKLYFNETPLQFRKKRSIY